MSKDPRVWQLILAPRWHAPLARHPEPTHPPMIHTHTHPLTWHMANCRRLVELNNGVNEAVAEVKAAYAAAAGVCELRVSLGPCTDVVLFDLFAHKGSSFRPRPDSVLRLLNDNADVRAADAELERARTSFNDYLASSETHVVVRVSRDGGALELPEVASESTPEQLQKLNTCLSKLRTLLGPKAHLSVTVKSAPAFGTETVKAQLLRRAPGGSDAEPMETVPLMEACSSSSGGSIKDAEAFLVDRAQFLALRCRGLEGLDWRVVAGHRLVLGAPEAIANDDMRDQVAAVLQAVNVALFKMLNAGASVKAPASLTNAVIEVVRPMFERLKQRHATSNLPYNLKVGGEPELP